jgi:hypothetical protein
MAGTSPAKTINARVALDLYNRISFPGQPGFAVLSPLAQPEIEDLRGGGGAPGCYSAAFNSDFSDFCTPTEKPNLAVSRVARRHV